jgi:putative ABC transport system permease protein
MLNWIRVLGERIRVLMFRRRQLERDLDDELEFHLAMHQQKLIDQGMPPEEARCAARRAFGNPTQAKETSRDLWTFSFLETLWQDLRYGLRQLRRNPGFTIVAVLTLALGIGANTAIFSVINAILIRPLPYPEANCLVTVWETHPDIPKLQAAVADYLDWRKQGRDFSQLAAYSCRGCWGGANAILTGAGNPEQLEATLVSANLFATLGAKPILGRTFLPGEDLPGKEPSVILSNELWQRHFNSSRDIVGRSIVLSGKSYTVVGVMASGFRFPVWADLWVPLGLVNPVEFTNRKHHLLDVVGRLSAGVGIEQAQSSLQTVARRLEAQYPATNRNIGVEIIPLQDELVGNLRAVLLTLWGAVGLVLLIACANVANLLLTRAAGRKKEMAVRSALGAGRARVARQLLTESVLLALIGGALGLFVAGWSLDLLRAFSSSHLLRGPAIHIDVRVLLFALAVSVLTGILFGLAPAFQNSGVDLNRSLKESGRQMGTGDGSGVRRFLVVAEIALALIVLVGAGLVMESFYRLTRADLGFNPDHVLTLEISLPYAKYNTQQTAAFYQNLLRSVSALPGVRLAGTTDVIPLTSDLDRTRFAVEGAPAPEPGNFPVCQTRAVSPDYFRVMQIPLIKGRYFTEADFRKSRIIINETMARRFFPHQDPVGREILMGVLDPNPAKIPIVGVVADSRDIQPYADAQPEIYWPFVNSLDNLVIRTSTEPMGLATPVRNAVLAIDKDQPTYDIRTMDQILSESLAPRRFSMLLLDGFAALALLLAAIGTYSVISFSVEHRTHEIGIRMALGAERRDVLGMVIGQGLKLVLTGVAIGVAGALALTRFLSSLLYGVKPTDPLTFIAVSLILIVVALLACYIPARRAAKVDPMVALRYE